MAKKKIVLDAGHGGHDVGATQVDGEREKAYNLKLTKAVRDILVRDYECIVYMTREGDNTMSLYDRGQLPNKVGADFFMSLHHNAGPSTARGAELYIHTTLRRYQGKLTRSYPEDSNLSSLAWLDADGHTNGRINHDAPNSRRLAEVMYPMFKQTLAELGIPWRGGIKCADFAVLRYPRLPCMLLETHFGTSPKDDAIADKPDFIPKLAAGLAKGIAKGLKLSAKPKPKKTGTTYTVKDGDNLSKIALSELGDGNRWEEIYKLNRQLIGRNPNLIRPGMKLTLPGAATRPYMVKRNDNLSMIALRELGKASRWPEIYDLNRKTIGSNPGFIKPGQVLQIPVK